MEHQGLPVLAFTDAATLEDWLSQNHATSDGIWVRLYKVRSGIPGISFHDLLKAGICFGWSESKRLPYDEQSYLQRFTPRRTKETTSQRNMKLAQEMIAQGKMQPSGRTALGLDTEEI